jgi:hypothetical protein
LVQTAAPDARAKGPSKRECAEANESAQDQRSGGHLREAATRYQECVNPSCPRPVREDCAHNLQEVQAAIPTVVLAAKDPLGQELTAVSVTLDGEPLTDHLDGTPIELDPGTHRFTFTVADQPPVTRSFTALEGEKDGRLEVVIGSPPPPPPPPRKRSKPAPPPEWDSDGSTRRWIGMGLGAGGLVAAGIGTVLSFLSKSTYDHAIGSECGGDPHGCTSQGAADGRTAHDLANASTVSFVAAGLLVSGGATLYFTAPSGARVTPTVGLRTGGVLLEVPW